MEDEKVVISSLVVEARPESVDAVARALAAMEGDMSCPASGGRYHQE